MSKQSKVAAAMSTFAFVGDPQDRYSGPNTIEIKGVQFFKNVACEVPEELVPFFEKHTHFIHGSKLNEFLKSQAKKMPRPKNDEDDGTKKDPAEAYAKHTIADLREELAAAQIPFEDADGKDVLIMRLLEANA